MILYLHVSCQGGAVGQNGRIADNTIMGNMDIAHKQVPGTDCGNAPVRHGAAVDGDVFPDLVIVADDEFRVLAPVF